MKRKLLSLLLALALLLTLLPRAALPVSAGDESPAYSGACGDDLTWRFDPDTGVLTLAGEGDMWDFWSCEKGDGFISSNGEPWYAFRDQILELELPEGLTSIGDMAFNGCWKLETVVIPNNVSSIGEYAFGACDALRELVIPEGVVYVKNSAFTFCTSLTEAELPESVYYVGPYAFSDCSSLERIIFRNPQIAIAESCLEGCKNVTVYAWSCSSAERLAEEQGLPFVSIGMPPLEGVCGEELTWRFDPDTGLLTVEGRGDMYDFGWSTDDSGVERPEKTWALFTGYITAISLPEGLTHIGDFAFCDCAGLTELRLPDSLTSLGDYAFDGCDGLTELTLSGHLQRVGQAVFGDCDHLETVCMTKDFSLDYRSIMISDMFFDYPDLSFIIDLEWVGPILRFRVDAENSLFRSDNEGLLYSKDGTVLIACPNGKTGTLTMLESVTEISRHACLNCDGLEEIRFPAGLTRIDHMAFAFCEGLTALRFPETLRVIEDCAFQYCPNLQQLELGEQLEELGYNAFRECRSLEELSFPASLRSVGDYAFYRCFGLRTVRFQEGLERIGAAAFSECYDLLDVSFPESLTAIGDHAFAYCGLRSVELPGVRELGAGAFEDCWSLREFFFRDPACVTQLREYTHMTGYCDNDTEEDLPIPYDVEHYSEYLGSLGLPEQTLVFGPHDEQMLDAGIWQENVADEDDYSAYEEYSYLETYAKTCGYTFCDTGRFFDVAENAYYELPVAWAAAMKVTSGTGNGAFSPNKTCTREQIVTFLWKAAGAPEPRNSENPFSDVPDDAYFRKAVLWAVENGVTKGVGAKSFGVGRPCTREQAMTFLWKAKGSPEPENTDSPFADVPAEQYYAKAVLWAVENGVTKGVGANRFGVGRSCTRAQIVTFLYKAMVMLDPIQPPIDELILNRDVLFFFAKGESYLLYATDLPLNAWVEWESEDPSVCTVDRNGLVTATGPGYTYITATAGELTAYCVVYCCIDDE
jgi:hypothetical protein